MFNLIISLDYEIFGNGAGDVMRDIIDPTNRILDICNRNDAKLTIMFEVAEYWAFKRYDKYLTERLGYSPSKVMENQAIKAVIQGHDIQLHVHPQWIGAEINNHGLWNLKLDQWGIGYLPNIDQNKEDIFSITGALFQGKKTLEDLLRPINQEYNCTTFRAGGFSAQPAEEVIKAMKNIKLSIDSSVVKGMKITSPVKLDYTNAKDNVGYWWVDPKDFSIEGKNKDTIIECPIYSNMEPYFKNFRKTKYLATLKRVKIEKADPNYRVNPEKFSSSDFKAKSIINKLFRKHPMKFDFCKLSTFSMKKFIKNAMIRELKYNKPIPIVMIGHAKDFWNDKHFDKFLNIVKMDKNIKFSTFADVGKEILF